MPILGCLGPVLGGSGPILGRLEGCVGPSWAWGPSGDGFGVVLDHYGVHFGARNDVILELFSGSFFEQVFGQSLDRFWSRFGVHFGDQIGPRRAQEGHQELQRTENMHLQKLPPKH